jgi:1,4-dihydroxy-2-naphthoate octaprenyltransferase
VSNLANDVFDFERGSDSKRSHGPTRVTQAGLISPRSVKLGILVVVGIAALAGLWLAIEGGLVVVAIGALAILSAIAYTGGPFPLAYIGLGDLFVFLFFGIAAVTGTYLVETRTVTPAAFAMSVPPGLIIVGILVVNNLRDIDEDREVGKRTLAVRFGQGFAKGEYLACILLAYVAIPVAALAGLVPWWTLGSWLSLPIAVKNTRTVFATSGRALNAALAGTGITALVFALLFAAGMGMAAMFPGR